MKTPLFTLLAPTVLVAASSAGMALAQTATDAPIDFAAVTSSQPSLSYSSFSFSDATPASAELPEAPAPIASGAAMGSFAQAEPSRGARYRPFLSYAVAFKIGSNGIGGEIATPLMRRLNLRVGGQAFSYGTNFTTDGVNADGNLSLQNVFAAVDYFPFHNGFHISPGLSVHNDNHVAATLFVPGGQTLTLGDVDYTSDPTDPIHGNTRIAFGNKVAPRITAGFGNMFPRSGGHWSFPTEFGFEYTSYPTMQLNLAGSGCSDEGCGPIDSPDNQANIDAERVKIVNDVAPLRFFPILSFGVSYRLGLGR